ncbi:MAG TPA: MG2 domain-containing protein, partial [Thermoanaerobaculia bacterium]|nr:MG2 domain-containing protein [Thermoanaerobaculia bacterium]
QAMLADWIRHEERPDALVRAHEVARSCQEDWPDTPGGQRCLDVAQEIEAPEFELKGMGSDSLDRRSLRVRHRNLAGLRFRAWAVDVTARLSSKQRHGLFPEDKEVFGKKPVADWRVDLPPTPDFRLHQTYVTPPIQRPGAYLIVATALDAPEEMTEQTPRATAGIILGDLVLGIQPGGRASTATVFSGASGEPLPGVEVRTCFGRGRSQTVVTGADGRVRLPACTDGYEVVLARRGEEVAVAHSNTPYEHPSAEGHTLFFTDRSVYRPQQKVFWKVLAYRRSEDVPVLAPNREIQVRLMDAFGNEVSKETVRTNAFGTAAGSFTLPPGRPLGSWTLASSLDGYASFRVEEYKRPTFEVTLDDPAEAVRLGRPATFSGQARYYFGLPVTDGSVRWRVVREPVWSGRWWLQGRSSHQERVVGSGTSPLEEDGAFRLTFTPSEDESAAETPGEDLTWRFRVEAEVTDANGETRDAERSFRLGRAAVEARILLPEGVDFLVAGRPWSPLTVLRTSLDGTPRPGQGSWTLSPLVQPAEALLPADQPLDESQAGEGTARTPGDRLRPREAPDYQPDAVLASWKAGDPLAKGAAVHGKDGRSEIPLPKLTPGAYRLVYETVDEFGTPVQARRELIVAGPKTPLALPSILKVDRSEARPGGVIRLLAHSGLPDQPLFLEIYSRGILRERRALRSGSDPSLLEIPVRPEDRGGLGFKLVGVRDHQLLGQTAQVFIPWDDRELSIELSTFRDKLRPGSRETWTVTVKTPGGTPEGQTAEAAAAEILASMYDRSLDLFQEHRPADLL